MGGPTPSITYAVDGPNAAPAQGDVFYWTSASASMGVPASPAGRMTTWQA